MNSDNNKRLTPKQAIKRECKYCLNTQKLSGPVGCTSEACYLSDVTQTALKRIKKHCFGCVPEQSPQGVRKCDGKVLNPSPHVCPLHPFRLGHNPARAGCGGRGFTRAVRKEAEKPQLNAALTR